MALHTILGGASVSAGAASAGMFAQASHASAASTVVQTAMAIATAAAAVGGFVVALVSFLRHRDAATALENHELHDDVRFDRLEEMIRGKRDD